MTKHRWKTCQNGESLRSSVTQLFNETEHYAYRPRPFCLPRPPVVATPLLNGEDLTFLEFINSDECAPYLNLLFDDGRKFDDCTDAVALLRDFRRAQKGHWFGHRRAKPRCRPPKSPGRLTGLNTKTRGALIEFARRAYRGDSEERGPIFWKRVAALIWQSYVNFRKLRAQCNEIKQREMKRIYGLADKRRKGAIRVQRHRARKKEQKR